MAKKSVSKEIKARTTGDERDEVISSTTAEIEKVVRHLIFNQFQPDRLLLMLHWE